MRFSVYIRLICHTLLKLDNYNTVLQFSKMKATEHNKFQAQEQNWIQQFSVADLSRCLIRQFCIKNNLDKTLKTFELEDTVNAHKKINKSIVIRLLSLNNLVYYNKQSDVKYKSLLEILVNYLKNKFKQKISKHQTSELSTKNDQSITPSINGQIYDNDWEDETTHKINNNNNKMAHSVDQDMSIKSNKILNQTVQLISKPQNQPIPHYRPSSKNNIQCMEIDSDGQNNFIHGQKNVRNQDNNKKGDNSIPLKKKTKTQPKFVDYPINQPPTKNHKQIEQTSNHAKHEVLSAQKNVAIAIAIANKQQSVQKTVISSNLNDNSQQQQISGSRMLGMKRKIKYQYSQSINVQHKKQAQTKQAKNTQDILCEKAIQKQAQPQKQKQVNLKKQEIVNNKQGEQGPKMVKMFGKKKKNDKQQKISEHQTQIGAAKFKFDQNFVDEPLNAEVQKYEYQKIDLFNITLLKPDKLGVNYGGKIAPRKLAEKQKNITELQAVALRQIIFQGQGNQCVLPKAWNQGFILSPHKDTPYGLKQIQGGPCGIIAAVQCYYLKHYLYMAKLKSDKDMQNQTTRDNCLIAAITDMLFKSRNSSNKIVLGLPPKGFAGNKIDYSSLKISNLDASTFQKAYQAMYGFKSYFIGQNNHGVTVLMICNILTKGIQKIKEQIDMVESPLIGNHGHCTQQLVNLFITGVASSNCFDGDKLLDSDMKLKGIKQKSEFGFLTIFETLKYIEVGKNLKNSVYPIWIICKQFHYHVIFANHYLISENNDAQKFDMVYFDGLYNCGDKIIITLEKYAFGEQPTCKAKDLPLIEQVMMTKWGARKSDWNGSIPIL